MNFTTAVFVSLIASALLITAHRLPVPILETETPPAKKVTATPKKNTQKPKAEETPTPAAIPNAGYQNRSYAATGIIGRLDADLIILQRGNET